ncbi:MAG: glycosyltransferase [Bacteroidales bacterium]|nr:glycosyltransferase [Bacteroidales bacterium]
MKKRIFIAIHYLEIGGAEISLIGLLQALDYSKYDVDLFVYSHRGELMQFIPKEVNQLPEIPAYAQIERPMKDALKDGYWRIVLRRLIAKRRFARYKKSKHPVDNGTVFGYVFDSVTPVLPSLEYLGEYDLAISFLTPHNIVADKVKAKKKAAWIHTDYSKIDVDAELELPVWSKFDHVVSISDQVTENFLGMFPSLKDKIVRIDNILSPKFVRERAEQIPPEVVDKEMPKEEGVTNLLSVGRFCFAKNYDNVPDICRRIIESGVDVRWYLIGYGGDEPLIRSKITEAGMENHVIILGKKSNPYPYIKACDIYVQPSRYEGNSVTVREAQILCKPVVVTDYSTVRNQVRNGEDGVIVPMDNSECALCIAGLVRDHARSVKIKISDFLSKNDFGNLKEGALIDFLL